MGTSSLGYVRSNSRHGTYDQPPTTLNTPVATTATAAVHSSIAMKCQSITQFLDTSVPKSVAAKNIVGSASGASRFSPGTPNFTSQPRSLCGPFFSGLRLPDVAA